MKTLYQAVALQFRRILSIQFSGRRGFDEAVPLCLLCRHFPHTVGESSVPYDSAQNTLVLLGADCYKICAVGTVIVIFQSVGLALVIHHFLSSRITVTEYLGAEKLN